MRMEFGTTERGEPAELVTLRNGRGLLARITDFGAALVELQVPDRTGVAADVVLGFDSVRGYDSTANQFHGATIGRVANRIAHASFTVAGRRHVLAANEPPHHLHGGADRPFHRVRWAVVDVAADRVRLAHTSPDGEEGYPGTVEASATYRLEDDALVVEYRATTDATTPINMTNHTYWNLAGAGRGTVLEHQVEIAADAYTPTDAALIPTGAIEGVAGTPLDLRTAAPLGERLDPLLGSAAQGFDHNFVLAGPAGTVRRVARVREPASGRVLELHTDQPCLQLYSGNQLPDRLVGKGGATYLRRGGLCLEPQGFPDAVHHPHLPTVLVEPGQPYAHVSVYRFPPPA